MSRLLLLTDSPSGSTHVLPALELLPHRVRVLPAEVTVLLDAPECDLVLVDGRQHLSAVRGFARFLVREENAMPLYVSRRRSVQTLLAEISRRPGVRLRSMSAGLLCRCAYSRR